MSRFSAFLLGLVTGAGLLHAAMTYHIVRAGDGMHFVAKQPPRLREVYVDIRQFGVGEWADHPQIAAALVQAGKQQLVGQSAAAAIQDSVSQLLPQWPAQPAQ